MPVATVRLIHRYWIVCVCACARVLFFLLYCFYGHFVWNKLHDDDDRLRSTV